MAAITTHSSGAIWWKATGKGRCGVFAVWKLCDPHLSTSAVSSLLCGAIQIFVFWLNRNKFLWMFTWICWIRCKWKIVCIRAAVCRGNHGDHVTSDCQTVSREQPSSEPQKLTTWRHCNHSNATRPCASRCPAGWLVAASPEVARYSVVDEESFRSWQPSWTDTRSLASCHVDRTLSVRSLLQRQRYQSRDDLCDKVAGSNPVRSTFM